jgi:hypothetical protein
VYQTSIKQTCSIITKHREKATNDCERGCININKKKSHHQQADVEMKQSVRKARQNSEWKSKNLIRLRARKSIESQKQIEKMSTKMPRVDHPVTQNTIIMEKLFNLIKHHNPKSSSDILRADELPTPLAPPPASGSLARASKRAPAAEDMALPAGETPPAPAAAKPGTASDEPARRDETALIRPDSF